MLPRVIITRILTRCLAWRAMKMLGQISPSGNQTSFRLRRRESASVCPIWAFLLLHQFHVLDGRDFHFDYRDAVYETVHAIDLRLRNILVLDRLRDLAADRTDQMKSIHCLTLYNNLGCGHSHFKT